MIVKYSPVFNSEKMFVYEFENDKIIAKLFFLNSKKWEEKEKDTFDFSKLGDGKLESVNTNLSINPILNADRKDGILTVTLIKLHGIDAIYEERYPADEVIV